MAHLLFSKGFLKQIVPVAQISKHALQATALSFHRFHLADRRYIRATILGPPFVKCRVAHPMFAAHLGNRHSTFGVPQDRDNLRFIVTTCLYYKYARLPCGENSTCAALCFRGDYPGSESILLTIFMFPL